MAEIPDDLKRRFENEVTTAAAAIWSVLVDKSSAITVTALCNVLAMAAAADLYAKKTIGPEDIAKQVIKHTEVARETLEHIIPATIERLHIETAPAGTMH
jgi:hypothetical protein